MILGYAIGKGAPDQRWRDILSYVDKKPFAVILGVIFALVLTTIVTQSFEFIAIRCLEGYWGTSWAGGQLAALCIARHKFRQSYNTWRAQRLDKRALRSIVPDLQTIFVDEPLLASAVERQIRGQDDSAIGDEVRERARAYINGREWLSLAPDRLNHRISALDEAGATFPSAGRMMPTRLGLVLRSGEDRLMASTPGANLRGLVIGNLANIDALTLSEHDQYRNRLDMYSVLTLLAAALAVVNCLVLWRAAVEPRNIAFVGGGTLALAWASYWGAVTTASDYITVLTEIDRQISDSDPA